METYIVRIYRRGASAQKISEIVGVVETVTGVRKQFTNTQELVEIFLQQNELEEQDIESAQTDF